MLKTIVGKRGRGKTTLAFEFIEAGGYDQIFVLDFLGEYEDLKGENVFIFFEDLELFYNRVRDKADAKKKTLVVFDEIDIYGKNSIPIAYLYRYGRHANVDIIAISRRFFDLPVIVRSLTDEFYLFQITEELDLKYLRLLAPKDKILKLINLKTFDYLTIKLN